MSQKSLDVHGCQGYRVLLQKCNPSEVCATVLSTAALGPMGPASDEVPHCEVPSSVAEGRHPLWGLV